jgi:hypothetical protein
MPGSADRPSECHRTHIVVAEGQIHRWRKPAVTVPLRFPTARDAGADTPGRITPLFQGQSVPPALHATNTDRPALLSQTGEGSNHAATLAYGDRADAEHGTPTTQAHSRSAATEGMAVRQ